MAKTKKEVRIVTWWSCKTLFYENNATGNNPSCDDYDNKYPEQVFNCANKCFNFVKLSTEKTLGVWYQWGIEED